MMTNPKSIQEMRVSIVMQSQPLVSGSADIPAFDREGLIRALRIDQAGESTFPEFLTASWRSGVVRYDVDFERRTVTYYGCNGEEYFESYPAVDVETTVLNLVTLTTEVSEDQSRTQG